MQFRVKITAQQLGAIGKHGTEKRTYTIDADKEDMARALAIDRACNDGLQHVKIVSCYVIPPVVVQATQNITWDR